MRISLGLAIAAGLLYLGIVLFHDAHVAMSAEVVDQSRVVMLFGALVLTALVAGGVLVVCFLPMFGDWIGNFLFNPNERIERSPHANALAASARGDFEAAILEYRHCLESDPADTLALSEISRLHAEKLNEPEAAAAVLDEALQREWSPEDAAFLTIRLAEVYWMHLHEVERARELLQGITASFPDTQHAVQARHRLREIEREIAASG